MSLIEKKLLKCKDMNDLVYLAKLNREDKEAVALIMGIYAEIQADCGHFDFNGKNFKLKMQNRINRAKKTFAYAPTYKTSMVNVMERLIADKQR